jgi:hypothetical protein
MKKNTMDRMAAFMAREVSAFGLQLQFKRVGLRPLSARSGRNRPPNDAHQRRADALDVEPIFHNARSLHALVIRRPDCLYC